MWRGRNETGLDDISTKTFKGWGKEATGLFIRAFWAERTANAEAPRLNSNGASLEPQKSRKVICTDSGVGIIQS